MPQDAAVDAAEGVLCSDSSVSSQQEPWSRQRAAGRRCTDSDAVQLADGGRPVSVGWGGPGSQEMPRQQAIASSSCSAMPSTDPLSVPYGASAKGYYARADMVASVASSSSNPARRTCAFPDLPASPFVRARRGLARGPDGQVLASVDEVYAQLMDDDPCCPSPASSTPTGAPAAAAAASVGNPQGMCGHGASLLSRASSTANSTVSTVCLGRQLSIPLSDAVPSPQYLHNWDDLTMPGLARIRTHRASAGSDHSSSNINADDSAACSSISDWQPHGAATAGGACGPPGAAAPPATAAAPTAAGVVQYPCTTATNSSSNGGAGPSPVLARHKSMPRLRSLVTSSSSSQLLTPPARSSCSLTSSGSGVGLAGLSMSATAGSYSSTAGSGCAPSTATAAAAGAPPISAAHRALFPTAAALPGALSRLQPSTSAPDSPVAAAGAGGDAMAGTAAAAGAGGGLARAQEDIREINQDNILSIQFGPTGAKLLAFKYCAATSPLSQPGRSPFASPRAPRCRAGMGALGFRGAGGGWTGRGLEGEDGVGVGGGVWCWPNRVEGATGRASGARR